MLGDPSSESVESTCSGHGPVSVSADARWWRPRRAGALGPAVTLVGLTGGIGSGKSTVAAKLAERGAVVVDADLVAREVVEPGRPAYEAVVERFGGAVVERGGELDRAALARIVFSDPDARAALNAIVHPEVGAEIAARLASFAGSGRAVVLDVPLLVEASSRDRYRLDGVLVVDAPEDLALERLVEQRAMQRADAAARIAAQASRDERIAAADFVIMNMGSLAELDAMVARAWEWIVGLRGAAPD